MLPGMNLSQNLIRTAQYMHKSEADLLSLAFYNNYYRLRPILEGTA